MKLIFTLVLCGMGLVLGAQTCILTSQSQDFCTECSTQSVNGEPPALINGVFSGTLEITTTYEISAACLANVVFSGTVVFELNKKNHLTFGQDPQVAEGTNTTVASHNAQGGGIIYAFGTSYTKPYTEFEAIMSPAAGSGGIGGGGSGSAQLPVTLLHWNATATSAGINLSWASLNETDNDYYSVEHSTDGLTFRELTSVEGSFTTTEVQEYAYRHLSPAAGTNYYRLVQYDIDGTRTRFGVVSAEVAATQAGYTLSPNPARAGQEIVLHDPASRGVTPITLHHIDGRLIRSYTTVPNEATRIQLPDGVTHGMYVVRYGSKSKLLVVR
ncbi:hypothetical protein GGR28_001902 [Lewinella aquimaris]|uniref:T9SS type A sorting domain-containing protein n=1 Tax=Neolewinella aquimaris TaxID=1835722 RepID=A0A840E6D3_9BACT|nr:hypothetical protein [Neolewinella aquimaris]MBB4079282.1 hypothetical protein [Neolewinella aquimaris]